MARQRADKQYRFNAEADIVSPTGDAGGKRRKLRMKPKAPPNMFGRRRFLEVSVGAFAASRLVSGEAANARLILDRPIEMAEYQAPHTLSSVKQIDAGVLNVGYVEAGPVNGPVAVLL